LLHTFYASRGKGVGRTLCDFAIAEAHRYNATYFRVSAEPDAVQFYEKCGFTFLGEQKSGSQLSMFKLNGPTYQDGQYDINDTVINKAVYRKGTIGRAKDHLEATAFQITDSLHGLNGKAYVSVNKALVTQASSAIPVIPLYISLLYKIMKAEGVHEGCIEQIQRLYAQRLYTGEAIPTDDKGRIRIDDWEMREDIQAQIKTLWDSATTENLGSIGDLAGYKQDFLNLFGFGFEGVDYTADTNEAIFVPSIKN
jgi:hypothetical protein